MAEYEAGAWTERELFGWGTKFALRDQLDEFYFALPEALRSEFVRWAWDLAGARDAFNFETGEPMREEERRKLIEWIGSRSRSPS